jgi:hypothetical protein
MGWLRNRPTYNQIKSAREHSRFKNAEEKAGCE